MDQTVTSAPPAGAPSDTPSRPEGTRAVRPRHAATLIIVRRDAKTPHVLMGRRGSGHDFMPDKWVFPGGRIDRSDYRVPTASELRVEDARISKGLPHKGRALGLSAIRETFEEAGLLLAKPAPPRSVAGPWREFFAIGALPDLDALDVIARAVTLVHPGSNGSTRASSSPRRTGCSAWSGARTAVSWTRSPGSIWTGRYASTCPTSPASC